MGRREEKAQIVAELTEKLKTSRAAIFVDYRGMNVAEATELRRSFREAGAEVRVVKNTLTRIAAERAGLEGLDGFLTGPTMIAFGFHDPVIPAKLLIDFSKNKRPLEIKGGLVEGRVVGVNEVKALADLPSRDVLISQVLRGLQGPLYGLVGVLQGPIRKLVYCLKAIQDQKAAG
ncbi:MAG: 50S ribosomal protein L10 [Thermacetogeniaceae bacterium]